MELKVLKSYSAPYMDLFPGDTTVGRDLSEEKKAQMLEDFPDRFEVIEDAATADETSAVIEDAATADETSAVSVETKVPDVESKEDAETVAKKAARSRKTK